MLPSPEPNPERDPELNPEDNESALSAAIKKRLSAGEEPGVTEQWIHFCDAVRDAANGWVNRKERKLKRGYGDKTIKETAKRGRTNTALSAMEAQRRARASLASERNEAAGISLAALKAERASVAAKGRQAETEAAPIRCVAELLGTDTDSERAIWWL